MQLHSHVVHRPPGPKHDNLHMAQGLTYCWCNCPRCFLRYSGDSGGICACRECPCAASYNARFPILVPHRQGVKDAR